MFLDSSHWSLSGRLFAMQQALSSDALPPAIVPFGEWLPDRPSLGNPGTVTAKNVIPCADGFRPMPSTSVYSSALTARCRGAAAAQDTSGNVAFYAGDQTKLYTLSGTTFNDASKVGGYSTAADGVWEFTQFGTRIIGTNYDDAVQAVTIGGSTFADLITSSDKPKARHLAVVREFVVLGNTNDATDGAKPQRVWWSGINNALDFTPAASTQCDFQDIPEGGWVQRVVGGVEYGLVFLERSIQRMTYVGSPLVFQFDPIDRQRGTPIPNSVISHGRLCFFISDEGFFVNDGVQSIPIGHNKVDRTFWNQFDATDAPRVAAAIDPVNKLVLWSFPGSGNVGGTPNLIWLYNWADQKWSQVEQETETVMRALTPGYTLDGLDAVSTNLDALAFSLDSRAWTGGVQKLAAFDTSHRMVFFDGSNMAATVDTGDVQPARGGQLSDVTSVRPLVDGGTITAKVASRVKLTDTVTFGSAISMNANGECPALSNGRYHRFRVDVAAGGSWNHAQGVEVTAAAAGAQ